MLLPTFNQCSPWGSVQPNASPPLFNTEPQHTATSSSWWLHSGGQHLQELSRSNWCSAEAIDSQQSKIQLRASFHRTQQERGDVAFRQTEWPWWMLSCCYMVPVEGVTMLYFGSAPHTEHKRKDKYMTIIEIIRGKINVWQYLSEF